VLERSAMERSLSDEDRARWRAKQAHYQAAEVARDYDAMRFATPHQRRSTDKKWRLIERAIGHELAAGARVLDVPSGTGRFTSRLVERGWHVVDADLSLPMLRANTHDGVLARVQADAEHLPFANASFDLVLCVRFLFHVPRELRAAILREMARVSRRFVIVDVRHRYCWNTHVKRLRARIRGARPPSKRMSLSEIDALVAASGLVLRERAWLAPGFSEKMLLVCERR
jgi:ubiquinone/menaquinone biosynthesis C-methylase UbiE